MDERERRMDKGRNFKCNPHDTKFFAVMTRRFGPNRVFFSWCKTYHQHDKEKIFCTTEEGPIEAEESCYQCKELLIQDVLVAVDKDLPVEASC